MKVETMKTRTAKAKDIDAYKSPVLSALITGFLILSVSGCSFGSSTGALSESYSVPKEALGVISIESPTVGSLLYLRGVAGKGVLIRKDLNSGCYRSAIRIAAGDFNGEGISIKGSKKIMLAVYGREALEKLKDGDEIVSEDYTVSALGQPHGDLEIISGLDLSQGFVLNPGEWSLSSLFGIDETKVDC